jgi:hypothetical protein
MMLTDSRVIIKNIRISEMQVKQKMIDWGVLDSSWIDTAIHYLALQKIGVDYENLNPFEQDKISERCNVQTSRVEFPLSPTDSHYQVHIELFPEKDVVNKCVKEN